VAKAIHANSARSDKPFVVVNSGSMPSDLLESNLFGHVKGAFTGAVASKKGLFEVADGGSIFFDEISNIGLDIQAKLLRVIQEKEFMRVGSIDTLKVDARLIAATNDDLKRMIAEGTFREDLYYRINVISMTLPPLRNKVDDIPLLTQYFLDRYGKENGRENLIISDDALELLKGHSWPGNVRELENAIERAVVLAPPNGDINFELIREYIDPVTFDPSRQLMTVPLQGLAMKTVVQDFQKQLIVDALRKTRWIQKEAAKLLDLKPTTLNEMIKRHGIREENHS
jgi:two-component system response regulator PilR (NtrC family)